MEYLLVMSLSGSTMTGIYLILRCLLRNKGCARSYYWFAKAAVLYYLIPLPFLKTWYRDIRRIILPEKQTESVRIPLKWTNYVVRGEEKSYLNIYARLQMTVIVVWLLVVCVLLLRQLVEYVRTVRLIARYADSKMTDRQRAVLEPLQEEYKVKRHVSLYQGTDGEPTITFGVFRPIILCGRDLESREAKLLIRHEMVHIKRWDVFWKILMHLVTFLHWWNPIMWLLYCDFERVCEWSCDETAMQDKTEAEVKDYLRLLIEESTDSGKPKKTGLRWRAGFGNNAQKIKERMDNLMKRRKWNKVAAGVLVAVLVFANSMTAFAYRDPVQREITKDVSQEEIEIRLDSDSLEFAPDGADLEEQQILESLDELEIRYDREFIDEEGNIYPVSEPVQRGCSHTYESGTLKDHKKYSDGSCEERYYHAQRCTKCGYLLEGDWIKTITYAVCPHQ